MNIGGGLRFDKIESSRPDMEGAYTQNYGVLSYGQGFRVHAIEMNGRYYAVEPIGLAGQRTLKLANHLSGKSIVDLHSMSVSGHTFQGGLNMTLSQTEADQLNAMRTLLVQSETRQNVSVWNKVKMVNDSIASMPGLAGLGWTVERYGQMLDDPSVVTAAIFVATVLGQFTPFALYGTLTDIGEFFEGFF